MANNLKTLSHPELLKQLKSLVVEEKKLTLIILDYLREVEERKLYLELGYSTLFAFATEQLGYCAGSAQLRIQAMRALKGTPEIRTSIEENRLALSVVAKTQSLIQAENRTLRDAHKEPLSAKEQSELFAVVRDKSVREAEVLLVKKRHEQEVERAIQCGEVPPPPKSLLKRLFFEVDPETEACIEELLDLLAHANPTRDLSALMKQLLPMALDLVKKRKGLNKPTEQQKNQEPKPKSISCSETAVTRHIPQVVKRIVWQRDQGECQFINPVTQKKCRSKHLIQYDHIKPFAYGSGSSVDDLFLTCAQHNRHRWEKHHPSSQ